MVAVIKGKTSKNAKISYKIDNQSKKAVKNTDGAYIIEVPAKTKQQTVVVTSQKDSDVITKKLLLIKPRRLANTKQFPLAITRQSLGCLYQKLIKRKLRI